MTTRFMMDYCGLFGSYWFRDARKQVQWMKDQYFNGEILVDEDLAVRWKSNGSYLFQDNVEMLVMGGIPVSVEATAKKREIQVERVLSEYRERMKNYVPSEEEIAEMRSAFGPGEKVVNVITGKVYQL